DLLHHGSFCASDQMVGETRLRRQACQILFTLLSLNYRKRCVCIPHSGPLRLEVPRLVKIAALRISNKPQNKGATKFGTSPSLILACRRFERQYCLASPASSARGAILHGQLLGFVLNRWEEMRCFQNWEQARSFLRWC